MAERARRSVNKKAPPSGAFPAESTLRKGDEVLAHAMSRIAVGRIARGRTAAAAPSSSNAAAQDAVDDRETTDDGEATEGDESSLPEQRGEPYMASLRERDAFTAHVSKDVGLFNRLGSRAYPPIPSYHDISRAIPEEGITVRNLMQRFAPKLSIQTIATFVEKCFGILTMDHHTHKLLPVPSVEDVKQLPEGAYRTAMSRATFLCSIKPSPTLREDRRKAFRRGEFEQFYFNRVRNIMVPVPGRKGREKKLWRFKSKREDEEKMEIFDPILDAAERNIDSEIAKGWTQVDENGRTTFKTRDEITNGQKDSRKAESQEVEEGRVLRNRTVKEPTKK